METNPRGERPADHDSPSGEEGEFRESIAEGAANLAAVLQRAVADYVSAQSGMDLNDLLQAVVRFVVDFITQFEEKFPGLEDDLRKSFIRNTIVNLEFEDMGGNQEAFMSLLRHIAPQVGKEEHN